MSVVARRANDYEAYEMLVRNERNERAVHLVTQTNNFLEDLMGKVQFGVRPPTPPSWT